MATKDLFPAPSLEELKKNRYNYEEAVHIGDDEIQKVIKTVLQVMDKHPTMETYIWGHGDTTIAFERTQYDISVRVCTTRYRLWLLDAELVG